MRYNVDIEDYDWWSTLSVAYLGPYKTTAMKFFPKIVKAIYG